MTKAELENKKQLGRSLYMSGMEQQEIAERLGVSRVTISSWCTKEGWKEARAAKSITRPELVNKLLLTIDQLIENVNKSNDPTLIGSLADKLSKLSAVVEKLDKKANVVGGSSTTLSLTRKSPRNSSRPSTSTRTSSSWKRWPQVPNYKLTAP